MGIHCPGELKRSQQQALSAPGGSPGSDNSLLLQVKFGPCASVSFGPLINFELLCKSLETEPFCLEVLCYRPDRTEHMLMEITGDAAG